MGFAKRRRPLIYNWIGGIEMILHRKYYWLEWTFIVAFLDLYLSRGHTS